MRNELLICVALIVALVVAYTFFHSRAARPVRLDIATVVVDSGPGRMREDFGKAAGSMKVAIAEFYVSRGQMPRDNAEAGLPPPSEYRGSVLRSATVTANGSIDFEFDGNSGKDGGHVTLLPDVAHANAMGVQWRCTTSDYPDIAHSIGSCSYASP